MKKRIFLMGFLFAMIGCGGGGGGGSNSISYTPMSQTDTVITASDEIFSVPITDNVDLTYTLELGSNTRNVFFIVTNTSTTATISDSDFVEIPTTPNILNERSIQRNNSPARSSVTTVHEKIAQRGKPEISDFNSKGDDPNSFGPFFRSSSESIEPLLDTVGTPCDFIVSKYDPITKVSTTPTLTGAVCRYVSPVTHDRTLNIYVKNPTSDPWNAAEDMPKVQAIADAFLASSGNDIYTWITNIFGEEWNDSAKPTPNSRFINGNKNITILLYDIDDDNSNNGGVVGYFWGKDDYSKSYYTISNERIMFYLDWVMLSNTADNGETVDPSPTPTWAVTDYWPQEVISTLAHEFQHMINFYQKREQNLPALSSAWFNEMCSMAAEDLVANKLNVPGPRGILNVNSAGTYPETNGRLPYYNYFNDYPVVLWDGSTYSYAVEYAFGAYLSRNYGGATFYKNLVQGSYIDMDAIVHYVNDNLGGTTETMESILINWGIANLLSDKTSVPAKMKYNNTTAFTSTEGMITYQLGPINLYNFVPDPYLYYESDFPDKPYFPGSNTYISGNVSPATGTHSWNFKLQKNLRLTVVVRP